jgi:predicted nucleic-acid-binding protein
MPAIDTNILIRYLVRDDEGQYQQVLTLFEAHRKSSIKVNLPVVVKTCWVLLKSYNYSKKEFIETFRLLLETQGFEFQSDVVIGKALEAFEKSNADFEDCLISELNKARNSAPTFTFDKKASKLKGMKLLE